MRKFLFALCLFLLIGSSAAFGQSFGQVNADRVTVYDAFVNEGTSTLTGAVSLTGAISTSSTASFVTSVTVTGAEAGNSSVVIDADEGDDNADTWTLRSTASDNDLDFLNHTSIVANLASSGNFSVTGTLSSSSTLSVVTSGSVVGAEAGNASVIIDADEGDDNADTWTVQSTAADNDLDVLNHTSTVLSVSPTGTITLVAQASAPTPAAGMLYVDTTSNELCYYDGSAWQGLSSGTDGNCS